MSESKTGAIPSVAAGGEHQLTEDTLIVVLGASGDLAKKKVSNQLITFARVGAYPIAVLSWLGLRGRPKPGWSSS